MVFVQLFTQASDVGWLRCLKTVFQGFLKFWTYTGEGGVAHLDEKGGQKTIPGRHL